MKRTSVGRMLEAHGELIHSKMRKVTSHVQRDTPEWYLNTVMIEGCDVPFKYKRKKKYKSIKGAYVDITYRAETENVAGIPMEIMRVIKINIS